VSAFVRIWDDGYEEAPEVSFPIVVNKWGWDNYPEKNNLFSVEEAEQLIEELEDIIEEIDLRRLDLGKCIVRVEFVGGGRGIGSSYAYNDPSGQLQVGDLVEVPTRYAASNIARVVGFGRDGYSGPVSDVIARLSKEDLS